MLKNDSQNYGLIAKILHWIMSIGVICLLIVGFVMTDMEPSDTKWEVYHLHKASGVFILCFAVVRLFWRLLNEVPPIESGLHPLHKFVANTNIKLLYLFMFVMPTSGIIMSLYSGRNIDAFLFTIPSFKTDVPISKLAGMVHGYSAIILCILIGLHLSGALFHHFILKNNTLRKML